MRQRRWAHLLGARHSTGRMLVPLENLKREGEHYDLNDQAHTRGSVIQVMLAAAYDFVAYCIRKLLCQACQMLHDQEHTTSFRICVVWDRTYGEPHSSGGTYP
jgi:hypothetical protein